MREVYLNEAKGSELKARFMNDFIDRFWESLDTVTVSKLRDKYFEVNGALCDALDSNIKTLQSEYRISLDMLQHMKNDEMHKHYAFDHLTRNIARSLLESDDIGVEIFEDWQDRSRRYRFDVPFIVLSRPKKHPTKSGEKKV